MAWTVIHAKNGNAIEWDDPQGAIDMILDGRASAIVGFTLAELAGQIHEGRQYVYQKMVEAMNNFSVSVKQTEVPADERLTELRDAHDGRKALIVAGGSSLNHISARKSFDKLQKLRTGKPVIIGVNRAEMATGQICDYLAVMDSRLYTGEEDGHDGWGHLFRGREDKMFVNDGDEKWRQQGKPFIFCKRMSEKVGFSDDLRVGFNIGYTTVILALQAAYHMGIREAYLAGVDLKHSPSGDTHFFGKVQWNVEHDEGLFKAMMGAFQVVSVKAQALGMKIYNLNKGSALKCFPFASWREIYG